jgi:ribonuclease HI
VTTVSLYSDGGQILASPSPYGGTWAYVVVRWDEVVVDEVAGLLLPHHLGAPRITNNDSEMYALLRGLEALPDGLDVLAYSDSQCTLMRYARIARGQPPTKTMNQELYDRAELALSRLGMVRFEHVKGHPTKKDLARGHDSKGRTVSPHQVRCDVLCTEQATIFLDDLRRTA